MRKTSFSHRGVLWAAVAVLAVAAPGAPLVHAATHAANLELLSAQLPAGVTPATAKMKTLDAAVRSAVAKRPADAADIVRIALLAKQTRKPRREELPCPMVREIVDAALAGAPQEAREILEMAQSLEPDCADLLNEAVNRPGTGTTGVAVPGSTSSANAANGAAGATGLNGAESGFGGEFNNGFGAGFPGAPGFGGSSPSGGLAIAPSGFPLPTPSPTPVTSAVNG